MNKELATHRAVRMRLEEAGATLLAMRGGHGPATFRSNLPDVVRDSAEAYGYGQADARPPIPSPDAIGRMDEALAWVSLIPAAPAGADPKSMSGGAVLRRVVQCRMLVSPLSWNQTPECPRYILSWPVIAKRMGADRRAVKRWYANGLALIVDGLTQQGHPVIVTAHE